MSLRDIVCSFVLPFFSVSLSRCGGGILYLDVEEGYCEFERQMSMRDTSLWKTGK